MLCSPLPFTSSLGWCDRSLCRRAVVVVCYCHTLAFVHARGGVSVQKEAAVVEAAASLVPALAGILRLNPLNPFERGVELGSDKLKWLALYQNK